jgi:integrase
MQQLPRGVILNHGRYYRKLRIDGKQRLLPLSRAEDGEAALFAALARLTGPQGDTIRSLLSSFLEAAPDLKPRTVSSYARSRKPLDDYCGHMAPDELEPHHVAEYLQLRQNAGARVQANREVALLSSAFSWGMRNGLCRRNPCYGVRRNRETPRTRYVRDEEFREAFDGANDAVQDLLAVTYLTGLRQTDLIALTLDQLTPAGLVLEESKTGKRRWFRNTDALLYFLKRAAKRSKCARLLTNTEGQPWTEWGIASAMRRLSVDWCFRDLRAKAESDHPEGLGMLPRYKRAKSVSPVR